MYGRLAASTNEIPLDYEAFLEVYEEANRNAVAKLKGEDPKETAKDAPGKTSNKDPLVEEKEEQRQKHHQHLMKHQMKEI